jgi:hypothetical protein
MMLKTINKAQRHRAAIIETFRPLRGKGCVSHVMPLPAHVLSNETDRVKALYVICQDLFRNIIPPDIPAVVWVHQEKRTPDMHIWVGDAAYQPAMVSYFDGLRLAGHVTDERKPPRWYPVLHQPEFASTDISEYASREKRGDSWMFGNTAYYKATRTLPWGTYFQTPKPRVSRSTSDLRDGPLGVPHVYKQGQKWVGKIGTEYVGIWRTKAVAQEAVLILLFLRAGSMARMHELIPPGWELPRRQLPHTYEEWLWRYPVDETIRGAVPYHGVRKHGQKYIVSASQESFRQAKRAAMRADELQIKEVGILEARRKLNFPDRWEHLALAAIAVAKASRPLSPSTSAPAYEEPQNGETTEREYDRYATAQVSGEAEPATRAPP